MPENVGAFEKYLSDERALTDHGACEICQGGGYGVNAQHPRASLFDHSAAFKFGKAFVIGDRANGRQHKRFECEKPADQQNQALDRKAKTPAARLCNDHAVAVDLGGIPMGHFFMLAAQSFQALREMFFGLNHRAGFL